MSSDKTLKLDRINNLDEYCPYANAKIYRDDTMEYNFTLRRGGIQYDNGNCSDLSYYYLQLLEVENDFVVWIRCGVKKHEWKLDRTQIYQKYYDNIEDAKTEFKKIFKSKTKKDMEKYEDPVGFSNESYYCVVR